ncbi:hypothetical protein COOONC_22815 [Cooperia oncophora]
MPTTRSGATSSGSSSPPALVGPPAPPQDAESTNHRRELPRTDICYNCGGVAFYISMPYGTGLQRTPPRRPFQPLLVAVQRIRRRSTIVISWRQSSMLVMALTLPSLLLETCVPAYTRTARVPSPTDRSLFGLRILVSKMKGFLMGNVWISESKEFALSWSNQSPVVPDCRRQVTVTDQGYAIAFVRRVPRSLDAGLLTTNQLSAQLLAVEGSVHDAVTALFHHAVQALCERTNVLAIALHSALRTDPTLTMRSLIGRKDITAAHLGNGFVQVRRCIPVPDHALRLLPFNGTCFSYPSVEITLRSGSIWRAFLNPSTGVIVGLPQTIEASSPHRDLAAVQLVRSTPRPQKISSTIVASWFQLTSKVRLTSDTRQPMRSPSLY